MSETDAKGPRVWVLAYDSNFDDYPPIVVFGPEISPSEMEVPVIEKSAYDQLAKELAAAEAALKHDVDKIEAAYINERTELLQWADRLAAALTWISKSEGLLGQAKQSLVEFQAWRERRGEG